MEAIEALKYVVAHSQDEEQLHSASDILEKLRQKNEALGEMEDTLRQNITLHPQDADAHFRLGLLLDEYEKRHVEAEAEYRVAISLNPDHARAYFNLGNVLQRLGRMSEAEDAFRKAEEIRPVLVEFRKAIQFLNELTSIASRFPDDFESRLLMANVLKHLNNKSESDKYANEARALISSGDWYNLARLESVCENIDAALDYLLRASEQADFDPSRAQGDSLFHWIHDAPRFAEIVVVLPEKDGAVE